MDGLQLRVCEEIVVRIDLGFQDVDAGKPVYPLIGGLRFEEQPKFSHQFTAMLHTGARVGVTRTG